MHIYNNPIWRWTFTLLYPAIMFIFQSWGPVLESWAGPIIFVALFCFLWSGIAEMFISTGLTWFVAIPCWWYFIERPKPSFGAENFAAHLWLIVIIYIVFVLIPQALILTTRLRIMDYYKK